MVVVENQVALLEVADTQANNGIGLNTLTVPNAFNQGVAPNSTTTTALGTHAVQSSQSDDTWTSATHAGRVDNNGAARKQPTRAPRRPAKRARDENEEEEPSGAQILDAASAKKKARIAENRPHASEYVAPVSFSPRGQRKRAREDDDGPTGAEILDAARAKKKPRAAKGRTNAADIASANNSNPFTSAHAYQPQVV